MRFNFFSTVSVTGLFAVQTTLGMQVAQRQPVRLDQNLLATDDATLAQLYADEYGQDWLAQLRADIYAEGSSFLNDVDLDEDTLA